MNPETIRLLTSLESRMREAIEDVSVRGLSDGPFLFATCRGRAAEASTTHEGVWWLELWEAGDDPDASPVKEISAKSEGDTYRVLMDWLKP